jgi:DMSO reductase family type II enzyme chaperone
MNVVAASQEVDQAVGRSAVYGLLAWAFAYPERGTTQTAAPAMELAALPDTIATSARVLVEVMPPAPEREAAFTELFTHSSSRDCPVHETAYTAYEIFQQTQQMADIAGFYAAFGVETGAGGERPDHISVELEFMQYLALKEAYARQHLGVARVRQCRRAQRLFLQEHLGGWGPAFGRRLEALDASGWYGRAGRLLAAWLEQDCRSLNAVPAFVVDGPRLAWPEPDDGECGAGNEIAMAGMEDVCGGCPAVGPGAGPAAQPGFVPLSLIES